MANLSRVFEFITEAFGWLRIVASPTIIGLGIGALIYVPSPTLTRMMLAIAIGLAGLIVGIIWANKRWKGKGTMWFLSQTNSTPDLDGFREEIESK